MIAIASPRAAVLAALLVSVTVLAWIEVLRIDTAMTMPMTMPVAATKLSIGDAATFTVEWGVMMAAMMLPSAAPMILLYRAVTSRLQSKGAAIPAELFAFCYLAFWLLTGVPLYLVSYGVDILATRSETFGNAMPFVLATTLLGAGLYQLSPAKHACLRACTAPVDFLMQRWRTGYAATLRLAITHAAFCIGCCWALMLLLLVAGAMSLPWVLAIALLVFAEKVLPGGGRTARVVGVLMIVAAVAVALQPELAVLLGPHHFTR